MPPTNVEPDSWLQRLQGDEVERDQAIGELRIVLVRGLRVSLASRYGGGLQAEDIAQEALLKILESLDSFRRQCQFTTWAMTIATRVGISELRHKHYQDVSLDSLTSDDCCSLALPVADEESVETQFQRRRLLQTLHELIETELTEKQRVAIECLLSGLPIEEIASRTGSNRNAVYKLIHDARLRLKAGLESAGISAEDMQSVFA